MKLLWVNAGFLHPTTRGGQIRTLGILRELHARHEVHYAALSDPAQPEGPARSSEYSARSYAIPHRLAPHRSLRSLAQICAGVVSPLPVSVARVRSTAMRQLLEGLLARESFDRAVCDFLVSSIHFPLLERALLFQHNVETMIWRRHAETAGGARRLFCSLQARRMHRYEGEVCRRAGRVAAVSATDADLMREMFGVNGITEVPTGVDVEYFTPRGEPARRYDLVFAGSMDWMPNIQGVLWFVREILPLIRRRIPTASVAVAGRTPPPEIEALARQDPRITVTGTVADMRPYLWESGAAIVPLQVGGGTRLKIYEAMAARLPVVSTAIGAEGLPLRHPGEIRIADAPEEFAARCVELLEDEAKRQELAETGFRLVAAKFSWRQAADRFEEALAATPSWRQP
jgi:glycosyltransferase involved in cell wall biosynthesis